MAGGGDICTLMKSVENKQKWANINAVRNDRENWERDQHGSGNSPR